MFTWASYDRIQELEIFLRFFKPKRTCVDCGKKFVLERDEDHVRCMECDMRHHPERFPPEMVRKYLGSSQ